LAANVTRLQFTTDYDLSTAPVRDYASTLPVAQRRPRLLILGQHTEYVTKAFRDWADLHVLKAGDMNLINFGANALYWQIRLEPSPARTGPLDFVCYKDASDPVSSNPGTVATSTVKWRSSLLSRPESKLFGAQYFAMVKTPGPFVITSRMPAAFLTGTGWAPGTALTGAAGGEADSVDPSTRSSVIATAQLLTNANPPAPFVGTITYRRPTLTSRVVNIGSLEWVKGYSNNVSFGVSKASFLRFNANLLRWAGASVQ
jgi:hypothetical protein